MRQTGLLALTTGAALVAAPCFAEPPELGFPIDCTLGETCYIEDYPDVDPGEGLKDYTCGLKTRDGHRGTDIVLLNFEAMEAGVNVLAAAPGRVGGTRDGMEDVPVTAATRGTVDGRECGNAVRIDHADGWSTLYCHMKRGSLQVKFGDRVERGDVLGQVGLSGLTNVPHVHLGVLKDGDVVDPFLAEPGATCGASETGGLWLDAPAYDRAGLFTAGFATRMPSFEDVQTGAARASLATPGDDLIFYGHAFYAQPGDLLHFRIAGPAGTLIDTDVTLDDPKAQLFEARGKKAPAGGWPEGAYRGYVTLSRKGRIIATRHADIAVVQD